MKSGDSFLESLEAYKDLFDHAHDLIHIVSPEGSLVYVNRAWQKHLGYSEEEIKGVSIYSLVSDDDVNNFRAYRERILKGVEENKELIFHLKSKKGELVPVEGLISLRSREGRPLYTRGIFRDISARLRNERQLLQLNETLRERESNLDHLLKNAPDAIIVIDDRSTITYWNPKAELIFGWSESEALGKNLSSTIIPKQYRELHNKGMERFLKTGVTHVLNQTIEITALNKDNQEFPISLTISSASQKGKPVFISFIRNIDKEKRNELELEKKNRQLEKSNEELEQFAHVASHDMKEPVRKIHLFTEQLKMELGENLPQKIDGFLQKIEGSALRLSNMIEGILAHSSLSSNEVTEEKINLEETIQQVESDLELVLKEKEGRIVFLNLPDINGAPFLIYQLFYNLISNSLKFLKPGIPPFIQIEGSTGINPFEREERYNRIIVRDNGIGFSNEQAENIFKKFSRLNPRNVYEGTGLGLSLCKSIMEKHGGFIEASGRDNEGATFTILFPE